MPCCGLHEYRVRVPWRYILAGGVVFWGSFAIIFIAGLLCFWTHRGRMVLSAQRQFVASLWAEAMRDGTSIPARWSCRLSGYVLPWSPDLAKVLYRRPEVPMIGVALAAMLCLVGAGFALWGVLG